MTQVQSSQLFDSEARMSTVLSLKKNDVHLPGSGSPQTASLQPKNQEGSLSPGSRAPALRTRPPRAWRHPWLRVVTSGRVVWASSSIPFVFFIKCPVQEPRRLLSQGLEASPGPPGQRPPGEGWLSRPPGSTEASPAPVGLVPTPFHQGTVRLQQPLMSHLLKKQFLVSESGSWKRNTLNLKQKTPKNLLKNLLNIA